MADKKVSSKVSRVETFFFMASIIVAGVKSQQMIENIGKILVLRRLRKGIKYPYKDYGKTYETAAFPRGTWNGCSSCAFLTCSRTTRNVWWTWWFRRFSFIRGRISLLWRISFIRHEYRFQIQPWCPVVWLYRI